MTRSEAQQLLPIIQAYSEGKEIEYLSATFDRWIPVGEEGPQFVHASNYRIKPEPIECWAVLTVDSVVMSTHDTRQEAENYIGHLIRPGYRVIQMREVP